MDAIYRRAGGVLRVESDEEILDCGHMLRIGGVVQAPINAPQGRF